MPTVCTTIKVSKDGQYILATGKHLCGFSLNVLHNRKCSGEKGYSPSLPQCSIVNISDTKKCLNEHLFNCDLDPAVNSLLCLSINIYIFFK